ncbi:hypothetical protein TNCV_112621 [Trichonephila clavipes]|nr:hypothetical protein TNCV_112621 [Trichonephila clavipes]
MSAFLQPGSVAATKDCRRTRSQGRDGEPLARGTIFWARHRSKRSTTIDSPIKEFSVRFSQFKELSQTLKFIMYPDVASFDKLNLFRFDVEK